MKRTYVTLTIYCLLTLFAGCSMALADHPSVGLSAGNATPITTTTAKTLAKGQWSTGFRFEYNDNNAISNSRLISNAEADEDADVHSVSTLAQYSLSIATGVTNNLTAALQIPYVKRSNIKEAHHDEGSGDTEI